MIKAVIFDLDNTLLDFVTMKRESVRSALVAMSEVGLDIDFESSYFDTDSLITRIESYQIERNDSYDDDFWVGVGTYNAYASDIYTIEVSTLINVNDLADGMTEFRVIANMEEGNFVSESEWGYSIDNIIPSTPDEFETSYNDNFISLSWNMIDDQDFDYFTIYKSYNSDNVCEDGDIIGYTTNIEYEDYFDSNEFVELNYGVTSMDINDNESECIIETIAVTEYSIGDINQDNNQDVLDLVILIDVILEQYFGGLVPGLFVLWACDLNDDNIINILDIIELVNQIMDIGLY